MQNTLTLHSPLKGPSSIEGCACQNLILWIVSWCTRAAWEFCVDCEVYLCRKEKAPPSPCCFPCFGPLFSGKSPPSSLWPKERRDHSALGFLWPHSRHQLCTAVDWSGHEVGLESLSWGKLDMTCLSPLLDEPDLRWSTSQSLRVLDLGRHFSAFPLLGTETLYLVFWRSTMYCVLRTAEKRSPFVTHVFTFTVDVEEWFELWGSVAELELKLRFSNSKPMALTSVLWCANIYKCMSFT